MRILEINIWLFETLFVLSVQIFEGQYFLHEGRKLIAFHMSLQCLSMLREDSQIDFSTYIVKWTLSPDPHPLSITSTDKNRFFKKSWYEIYALTTHGRRNVSERFAPRKRHVLHKSCLLKIKSIKFNLFQLIDGILRQKIGTLIIMMPSI